MARKVSLLDCTLRDGGYLNDWNFGHQQLVSMYSRLVDSRVDYVELGFIDERRPFDINRSIMPDEACMDKLWGDVRNKAKHNLGMIDYGTCGIDKLRRAEESLLDGIRVIFKKERSREAMEFCAEVKALGYRTFSQLVSITAYNDDELKSIAALVNEVKPYAVSMVDTYGLLEPERLLHITEILDSEVDKDICIGFHAHNNMQLAYANCRAFLSYDTKRELLVDGTLYGMGKSAGNAPLELLAMHMNDNYGKAYRVDPMLEAIDESILEFQKSLRWGYQLPFLLAAKNECHPAYVNYLADKDELSVSRMDEILSSIEPREKKLLYDRSVAENIFSDSVKDVDDEAYKELSEILSGNDILLLGPGKNIRLQRERVDEYVKKHSPLVIAVNFIPEDIPVHFVFVSKKNRYQQLREKLEADENRGVILIATENVSCGGGNEQIVLMREPLLEKSERISDNSFLMLLKVLKKANAEKLACAGFDGYSKEENNYLISQMEYDFVRDEAERMNRHVQEVLRKEFSEMKIDFITYSRYTEEDENNAGF